MLKTGERAENNFGLSSFLRNANALLAFAFFCAHTLSGCAGEKASVIQSSATTTESKSTAACTSPLKISKIAPNSQRTGGNIFIKGSCLSSVTYITLGAAEVTDYLILSDSAILIVVPSDAPSGESDVTVFDADLNSSTSSKGFTLIEGSGSSSSSASPSPSPSSSGVFNTWLGIWGLGPDTSTCVDQGDHGEAAVFYFDINSSKIYYAMARFTDTQCRTIDTIDSARIGEAPGVAVEPTAGFVDFPAAHNLIKLRFDGTPPDYSLWLAVATSFDSNRYNMLIIQPDPSTSIPSYTWTQWLTYPNQLKPSSPQQIEDPANSSWSAYIQVYPTITNVLPSPSSSPSSSPSASSSPTPSPSASPSASDTPTAVPTLTVSAPDYLTLGYPGAYSIIGGANTGYHLLTVGNGLAPYSIEDNAGCSAVIYKNVNPNANDDLIYYNLGTWPSTCKFKVFDSNNQMAFVNFFAVSNSPTIPAQPPNGIALSESSLQIYGSDYKAVIANSQGASYSVLENNCANLIATTVTGNTPNQYLGTTAAAVFTTKNPSYYGGSCYVTLQNDLGEESPRIFLTFDGPGPNMGATHLQMHWGESTTLTATGSAPFSITQGVNCSNGATSMTAVLGMMGADKVSLSVMGGGPGFCTFTVGDANGKETQMLVEISP